MLTIYIVFFINLTLEKQDDFIRNSIEHNWSFCFHFVGCEIRIAEKRSTINHNAKMIFNKYYHIHCFILSYSYIEISLLNEVSRHWTFPRQSYVLLKMYNVFNLNWPYKNMVRCYEWQWYNYLTDFNWGECKQL